MNLQDQYKKLFKGKAGSNDKKLLSEAYAWERVPGQPLPTVKDVAKKHNKSVTEASSNSYKTWRSRQSPNELEQVKQSIADMSNEDYWKFGDWVLGEFRGLNPPHGDGDIMDRPEFLDDWLTGQVSNKPAWKLILQQLKTQRVL